MIKHILSTIACTLLMTATVRAEDLILPEVPTPVQLSNHDLNRIVCPGTMQDLIFSKEKGLTGRFSGNSAFIKFMIKKSGEEYIYATTPSEIFAICNGSIFTLIATPADIPSVTLRLASPKGDTVKQNLAHYQNMPLEKQALQIIREAYNGSYPSSYLIQESDQQINLDPDLDTRLVQAVDVDGVGLRLKKYEVKSMKDMDLTEKTFLNPAISNAILPVAVEDHNLKSDETTRVFVVEKKEVIQ